MYKKIPGNHNFIIFPNGEIKTLQGKPAELKEENGFVNITLFGVEKRVCKLWLSLIAHYEFTFHDQMDNVIFKDCDLTVTKNNCGKFMVFKKPIEFVKGYRIVPGFTRYAVSFDGQVIDTETMKMVKPINNGEYVGVYIYNPDQSAYVNTNIHRLVAVAWVPNDDFLEKPIVNHIDGNKGNPKASNLEWCSFSDNLIHAYQHGLRKKPIEKYKTRDIETGEIMYHDSMKELCEHFGLDYVNHPKLGDKKTKHNLIKHRYQLKKLDDMRPWKDVDDPKMRKNKYTIEIVSPDGSKETFQDIVSVMKRLKIWNISYNINEIIRVAKIKHPEIEIRVTENVIYKKVEAKNAITGEIIKADSIGALARILGINKCTITAALNRDRMYVCKGYIFRHQSDEPWPKEVHRHTNGMSTVEAIKEDTGEKLLFSSIREFCKLFGVSYYVTKSRLIDGELINGWRVVEKIPV